MTAAEFNIFEKLDRYNSGMLPEAKISDIQRLLPVELLRVARFLSVHATTHIRMYIFEGI